jgi:amino acid transporter
MAEKSEEVVLPRVLDTKLLILQAVGGIFGGGLYGMSGSMIGLVGDAVWMPMFILFFTSLLDAFIYMEFASCYPKMATVYVYIKEGIGGKIGEAISWTLSMYTSLAAFSSVFICMTAAGYLSSFFTIFNLWNPGIVVTTFVLWTSGFLLQCWGVKESVIIGDIMSVMELGMVALLIAIGFAFPTRSPDYLAIPTAVGLAQAMAMGKFAYSGYAAPSTYIEETKEPAFRNVWRACMGSIGITLVGYVSAVVAMVRMNPPKVIAFAANPFVASTTGILGGVAPLIFAILGTPSAYNGVLFGFGTAARRTAGMAMEGNLPKFFGWWWKKRATPVGSLIFRYAAGLPFVFIGSFPFLTLSTAAASLITTFVLSIAFVLFNLRRVVPDDKKPWKAPLKIGRLSIPGVVGILFMGWMAVYQRVDSWIPSFTFMTIAAVMYVIWSQRGRFKK